MNNSTMTSTANATVNANASSSDASSSDASSSDASSDTFPNPANIFRQEQEQEQQKHFNEIAEMMADNKITTEQACSLFKELCDEQQQQQQQQQLLVFQQQQLLVFQQQQLLVFQQQQQQQQQQEQPFQSRSRSEPSICIPRVFKGTTSKGTTSKGTTSKGTTSKDIYDIIEKLDIGAVDRIDMVPKTNDRGESYHKVFIHFKMWHKNPMAQATRDKLLAGEEIKIVYNAPWFWKCTASRVEKPIFRDYTAPPPRIDLGGSKSLSLHSAE